MQPTLFRLGEPAARYESLQQFLADSPWDPGLLARACAERVAAEIGVVAWVVDDTGIKKDGKHSPGVQRQWSGTLGKIDNCQITVSVHAVGERGTLPLGWALYLPRDWCSDRARREQAKIPAEIAFQTKPQLAVSLAERAVGWRVPQAPILGDCAYGDDSALRTMLHALELEYLLAASAKTLPCRTSPAGEQIESRFAFVRVVATHAVVNNCLSPRWEWLIIEWPEGEDAPSDYWLSNLPSNSKRERLARLARPRWTIELDYRQLKGELGLDHYEGRSYPGFHHHCALVTCAHAFLTLERLCPKAPRPA